MLSENWNVAEHFSLFQSAVSALFGYKVEMGSEVGDSLTWSESLDRSSCNELVDKANDLLIYRKFDKCLDVCQNGLAQAKNFPENERSENVFMS